MRPVAEPAPHPYRPFRRDHLLFLVAITLVATALRLFRLGEWAFWVDEAHTFRDVMAPENRFWSSNVSNYPLSYVVVRWLLDIGLLQTTGEGWLRLPFAFVGILTVPAVALFGRSVVGRRAALLAAAFLAVSPWHLYWSQNARGYSLMMLFGLLAAFGAHRAARYRSWPFAVGALVAAALSGLAHPSGALVLLVMAVLLGHRIAVDPALRRALTRPLVLVAAGVVAVLLAAWLVPTVGHAITEKPGPSIVHLAQTFSWFFGPPFIVAAVAGACLLWLRAPRLEAVFLLGWVGAPVAVLVAAAVPLKVTAQYGMVVLPAVFLLASRAIVELADAVGERSVTARVLRWSLPFVLLATLLSDAFLYYFQRNGERPLWRDAAAFVQADSTGPRTIWSTNEQSMRYYLDRGSFWGRPNGDTEVAGMAAWLFDDAGGGDEWFAAVAAAAAAADRELYFVLTEPELAEWDHDGSFDRALRANAHQLRRYPCWVGPKDMTVLVYKVPPPPPLDPAAK